MNNGRWSPLFLPFLHGKSIGVDPEEMIAPYLTAFSGFFAQVLNGRIYRNVTLPIKPAIEDSRNGRSGRFLQTFLPALPKTWKHEAASISRNVLLTERSLPLKRGLICGKNEAWKGKQDHGNRWPHGSSGRHPHGLCFSARSHPGGSNACTEIYARNSKTPYRRSGLWQRSIRSTSWETKHWTDRSSSVQSSKKSDTRRKKIEKIQTQMESGAIKLLASAIQKDCYPIRILSTPFSYIYSVGMYDDFITELFLR